MRQAPRLVDLKKLQNNNGYFIYFYILFMSVQWRGLQSKQLPTLQTHPSNQPQFLHQRDKLTQLRHPLMIGSFVEICSFCAVTGPAVGTTASQTLDHGNLATSTTLYTRMSVTAHYTSSRAISHKNLNLVLVLLLKLYKHVITEGKAHRSSLSCVYWGLMLEALRSNEFPMLVLDHVE